MAIPKKQNPMAQPIGPRKPGKTVTPKQQLGRGRPAPMKAAGITPRKPNAK